MRLAVLIAITLSQVSFGVIQGSAWQGMAQFGILMENSVVRWDLCALIWSLWLKTCNHWFWLFQIVAGMLLYLGWFCYNAPYLFHWLWFEEFKNYQFLLWLPTCLYWLVWHTCIISISWPLLPLASERLLCLTLATSPRLLVLLCLHMRVLVLVSTFTISNTATIEFYSDHVLYYSYPYYRVNERTTKVSKSLDGDNDLYYSTIYICRRHLIHGVWR